MLPDEDASSPAAGLPAAETAAVSAFAAAVFGKQPFKGYELEAVLASSDRTAVFKAQDRNMGRPVALKVMRPWPGRDGVVEEFFSLAGSIARLRCPGVARGLDVGRGDGDFFLAYEFLSGETLAERLRRRAAGRLTEKEAAILARETATVLHRLFEMGHPHGHLTPGNMILGERGAPRLTDIGFAWTLAWPDDAEAFRTAADFLPPERIAGEFNVDIRGDLYSLGAVWHLCLAGRPVFRGATPEETLAMHLEEEPPSVREADSRIGAATATLIRWLLEKDRDSRPRTPREFLRKLASHPLLAEEPGPEPPVPAGEGEAGDGGR